MEHTTTNTTKKNPKQGWCILFCKGVLWVCFLNILLFPRQAAAQDRVEQIRITVEEATVYDGPGTGHPVLLNLPRETILPLLGKEGVWWHVQLSPEFGTSAVQGFIHESNATILGEAPDTTVAEAMPPPDVPEEEGETDLPEEPGADEISVAPDDEQTEEEPDGWLPFEEPDSRDEEEVEEQPAEEMAIQPVQRFWHTIPPVSLAAGLTGWGGTLQHAGFELSAGVGSRPVRYRVVWSRGVWGSDYTTEWLGLELQAYTGRIGSGELRLGVTGGRYSEIRTFSAVQDENEDSSDQRITEHDAVFGFVASTGWPLASSIPGSELEVGLRWLIGLGDNEDYHIPILRATLGFSSDRLAPRSWSRSSRMAVYLAGGLSNGRAEGNDLLRPAARFGLDIAMGNMELRLMSAAQVQNDLFAPSAGAAFLVPAVPGRSLSLHIGGGVRWYNEIIDDEERQHAWFGGLLGELRYRLGGRVSLTLTGKRSWGFADAGHLVRMDDLSLGLRTILWR